jgi:hypothetical protein
MQVQNNSIINVPFFKYAVIILILGYGLMALVPFDFFRLTLSPIVIILSFVLFVLSVMLPSKA